MSQTYTNIEVILVNDGSKDDSINICNNYAEIDPRVKVIDIQNSGVSHARNIGIENATGYYLQFVDSDDVIANNMVEKIGSRNGSLSNGCCFLRSKDNYIKK